MAKQIHLSRVVLALGVALTMTACTSMNKPLSKSHGVATEANMRAQIVPVDPGTIERGPTPTSAERVGVGRDVYDAGQDTTTEAERTGGK